MKYWWFLLIFGELKVALTPYGIFSLQEMVFKNIFSCAVRGYHFCRNTRNSTKETFFCSVTKSLGKCLTCLLDHAMMLKVEQFFFANGNIKSSKICFMSVSHHWSSVSKHKIPAITIITRWARSFMHCNSRGAWYCYQQQNIGQVYRVCKYSIQRSSGIIVSKPIHRGHWCQKHCWFQ